MIVFESIEDVLKGKTQDEIQSNFKEKYGVEFSEMAETIKRLQAEGVDAEMGYFDAPIGENNKPIKIPVIEVYRLEIKNSANGHSWDILGTTLNMKGAEEIVNVLKKYLNIGDKQIINSNKKEYLYKIEKESFTYCYSNIDALKILAKIKKQNES